MAAQTTLGGSFKLANTSITVNRMGYGAMKLTGPEVWGPPKDENAAIALLREAVASGVNHIDTSDFYGPHVSNRLIKQALHPYPKNLVIVTKVGARRGPTNPGFRRTLSKKSSTRRTTICATSASTSST